MLGFAPLGDLPLAGLPGESNGYIFASLYVDPDTFYAATVSPGPVSITATLYTDADTFYSHTVSATYTITGALYTDPDSFYGATLSSTYSVTAAYYEDPDSFESFAVSASYTIRPALYEDPDYFGSFFVTPQLFEFVSPGHERCMRCGQIEGQSKLKREWTGLIVCRSCFDPKHPQISLRGVPDDQTVPWKRPVPTPVFLNPGDVSASDL